MTTPLPTMKEIRNCFEGCVANISGKFRTRSYTAVTANEMLLMKPSRPATTPSSSQKLKSQSITLPLQRRRSPQEEDRTTLEATAPGESPPTYDFYCKNVSSNLTELMAITDISHNLTQQLPHVSLFDHDQFDVNERIIPAYYINHKGIKPGTYHFDFYHGILDSIRNLRPLSVHQIAFLEQCSREEYMEILREYDNVIQAFVSNKLV